MTKEIFLSHAWGTDDSNRNNHNRVKNLLNGDQNLITYIQ